jgi:hypothetical protein
MMSVIVYIYSTSRCREVQEPHPQPPPRKQRGGYNILHKESAVSSMVMGRSPKIFIHIPLTSIYYSALPNESIKPVFC